MGTTLGEIRKVAPPRISPEYVGSHVHAYVSMNGDSPVMTLDEEGTEKGTGKYGKKVVAHNYGHGGCGWSLAPGSAAYVGEQLAGKLAALGYGKAAPICVIGAGVIGLFTARDLLLRGYTNVVVRAADELASHRAGATGLWAPLGFRMESEDSRRTLLNVCRVSREFYSALLGDPKNPLHQAVKTMPLYTDSVLPVSDGLHVPPKPVTLDFGNGVQREMFAYDDAVYIETDEFMRRLRDDLRSNGVRFEQAKVASIFDAPENLVVNCAGVGARELDKNSEARTFFLHLTHLCRQDALGTDFEYMIFAKANEGMLSYFPKNLLASDDGSARQNGIFGAIGGSFVEAKNDVDMQADEVARVLRDAHWFFCGQ